mmetsp:Transcript_71926/g.210718  ORF Transcript_71926/g.210718 Transcript_71926/m.210718 type:complete len:202 (+) Transcript_71926:6-611(+)
MSHWSTPILHGSALCLCYTPCTAALEGIAVQQLTPAGIARLIVVDVGHEQLLALCHVAHGDGHGFNRACTIASFDIESCRAAVVCQGHGLDQAKAIKAGKQREGGRTAADLHEVHGPSGGNFSCLSFVFVVRGVRAGLRLPVLRSVPKKPPGQAKLRELGMNLCGCPRYGSPQRQVQGTLASQVLRCQIEHPDKSGEAFQC